MRIKPIELNKAETKRFKKLLAEYDRLLSNMNQEERDETIASFAIRAKHEIEWEKDKRAAKREMISDSGPGEFARAKRNPSRKSLRSLKRAEHEHYSRPGVSIDIDVESHNAKRGSRTRVNPRRLKLGKKMKTIDLAPKAPGEYLYAYKLLRESFGPEFDKLSNTDAALIGRDFLEATEEDGIDSDEYLRRIGRGNLQSYAEVMRVRARKGWNSNPMKGSKHIALQEKRGENWFTIAWFPHNQKATAIKIGKQLHRRYPNKTLRLFA